MVLSNALCQCRERECVCVCVHGGGGVSGDSEKPHVYALYSRKHGDLERDYNAFVISPEPYSHVPFSPHPPGSLKEAHPP